MIIKHQVKTTIEELTRRELEVLTLLSDGMLYKEIAKECNITIDTVKKHCKNIYKKLKVRNRTEAAQIHINLRS